MDAKLNYRTGGCDLIFLVYSFYTLLIMLAPFKKSVLAVLVGCSFMWVVYFFYRVGWTKFGKLKVVVDDDYSINNYSGYLFWSGLIFLSAIYVSYFYTGNTPSDTIGNLIYGVSNYNSYQRYFSESGLGVFTFNKIPAILLLLFIKISLVYMTISVFISKDKSYLAWSSVILSCFSYIYLSLSRGTSFEVFEILVLFLFCFFSFRSGKVGIKSLLLMAMLIFFSIVVYYLNVAVRYGDVDVNICTSIDMCFDENSLLGKSDPVLTTLLMKLASYFSFGIVYIGNLFLYYIETDSIHYILMPGSSFINSSFEHRALCGVVLDCSAFWSPDMERLLYVLGVVLALVFIMLLGAYCRHIQINSKNRVVEVNSLIFFIFFTMLSLPVGNFITSSSSNFLAVICLLLLVFFKRFIYRIKYG